MRIELYPNDYCADGYCDEVEACGNINASTDIYASFYANDEIPLATDGEWELWSPATWEGVQKIASIGGNKARWCFAYSGNDRYWRTYTDKGPLYIFVNTATGEKYASHPATKSWFYDDFDREQGLKALTKFLDEHPKFIVKDFQKLLQDSARNGWKGTWLDKGADEVTGSTSIDAAIKSKYDNVRKLFGEDEWYYIEEYLINGDGKYSLEDIVYDETAWDHYADWKMKKFGKKAFLSAATRIAAKKILASTYKS
jgi:hypothetical protein